MYLLRIRRWAPQLGRRSLRTVSRWPASRFPSRQTVTPLFSVRKVYQPSLTRTTACIPTVSRQSTRSYSNRRKLRIIYDEDEDEEVYEPTHKNIEDHIDDTATREDTISIDLPIKESLPGQLTISYASWQPDLHTDTPIEFIQSGIRKLGLLQQPRGKRDWLVLDELGQQQQVNQYSITFQWPSNKMSNGEVWTVEELHQLRLRCQERVTQVMKEFDAEKTWLFLSKLFPEESIRLDTVARLFFNKKESEEVTPEELYVAHMYLSNYSVYYASTARAGFMCIVPDAVLALKELKEKERQHKRAAELFLRKLKKRLDKMRAEGKLGKALNVKVGTNIPRVDPTKVPHSTSLFIPKEIFEGNAEEAEEEVVIKKPPKDPSDKEQISELTNAPVKDKWDVSKDIEFMQQLKAYALSQDEEAIDSTIFTRFLYPLGYGDRPHDAFQLLVDLGVWDRYQNPHVLRWGSTPLGFEPEEIKAIIKHLKNLPRDPDETMRVDMTDIPAFAIDPANAHEVDDAISVVTDGTGLEWVWIHIADPTRFVPAHSKIDKMARIRCGSIFLPDQYFPMFHPLLLDQMSFKENEKRPALSFGAVIDQTGAVVKYRIVPSYIKNVITLSYLEADQVLLGETVENAKGQVLKMTEKAKQIRQQYYDKFNLLENIAVRRRKYRADRGAVIAFVPKPEVKLLRDNENNAHIVMGVSGDLNKHSRGIVTELSLLAGELAGTFLSANEVPAYYHIRPLAQGIKRQSMDEIYMERTMKELKHRPRSTVVVQEIDKLKRLGTPYVDSVPDFNHHYGFSRYTTVTSPLRRYFDFVIHHQIKATLRRGLDSAPYTLSQLHECLPEAHSVVGEMQELQEKSSRFWILNYLYEQYLLNPKKTYPAVVIQPNSELSDDQATIMLTQFALQCDMTKTRYVNRGEPIQVRVELVSPFYDKLIVKEARD